MLRRRLRCPAASVALDRFIASGQNWRRAHSLESCSCNVDCTTCDISTQAGAAANNRLVGTACMWLHVIACGG